MTVHDDLATLRTWADDIPGLGQKRYREALSGVEAEIARLEQERDEAHNNATRYYGEADGWLTKLQAVESRLARLEEGLRRVMDEAPYLDGPEKELIRSLLADQDGAA